MFVLLRKTTYHITHKLVFTFPHSMLGVDFHAPLGINYPSFRDQMCAKLNSFNAKSGYFAQTVDGKKFKRINKSKYKTHSVLLISYMNITLSSESTLYLKKTFHLEAEGKKYKCFRRNPI